MRRASHHEMLISRLTTSTLGGVISGCSQAAANAAAVHKVIVFTATHVVVAIIFMVATVSGMNEVAAGATVHHAIVEAIHTFANVSFTAFLVFFKKSLVFLDKD
jgi:hypothetical protein